MTTTHRARTAAAATNRTAPHPRRTVVQVLTGLGAAVVLLAGVIGVPLALSVVAPIGLPDAWPVWSELGHIVMRPDDGRLAVAAIRLVAWIAWAAFTWAVVLETLAALRNTTAREVHALGAVQRAAATLVGAVLLALASPAASSTVIAGPDTIAVQVVPDAARQGAWSLTFGSPQPRQPDAGPATQRQVPADLPVVTVLDGDSLWFIAERHLGSGSRYPEILDLNLDRPQPDGLRLTDAHWIEPGWQFVLPLDAVNLPASVTSGPTNPVSPSVVVAPGDSLWALAEEHLGDGDRYPEIVALNVGVNQPDGAALSEPDLIRPGWVLTLPAAQVDDAPAPGRGRTNEPDAGASGPDAVLTPATPSPVPDAEPDAGTDRQPDAGTDAGTADSTSQPAAQAPSGAASDAAHGRPAALAPEGISPPGSAPVTAAPVGSSADSADQSQPGESSLPGGLYLGLTALAAAGIVGELARRRQLQHRVRRTGERIPLPDPTSPAAAAERQWHAATAPLTLRQIRTALDSLAAGCFAAGRDLPRIGALEVAPDRVTLHMVDNESHPKAPFAQSSSPRAWTAPTAALGALEPVDTTDCPEPYPAMVTIGHTERSTIVLNLEAAGTLRLIGDPDAAAGALRAMVAELATSELSGRLGLTGGTEFTALAAAFSPARVQAAPSPTSYAQLADRLANTRGALDEDGADDTLQARSDRQAPDLWLPVIYVDDAPGPAPAAPWSGSILLTGSDGPGGWRLNLAPDGRAHLVDLDLGLTASRLAPEGLSLVTDLLTLAASPDPDEPPPSPAPAEREAANALTAIRAPVPPSADDDNHSPAPSEPGLRIRVLGPLRFENVPTDQTPSAQQAELLALLALRGVCTGREIDDALWPGRRTDGQARWGLAYRARQVVLSGNLPQTPRGDTLRLGAGVSCDWTDFQVLAARGLAAGSDGIEDLQAAICLVRGRPLAGAPPSAFGWADPDVDEMISAIVDVAHTLARLLIETGDPRGALSAATIGLSVDACSDRLRDDAVTAARAYGDSAEALRIQERYDALVAELDDELV